MYEFSVRSSAGSYQVVIGPLAESGEIASCAVALIDPNAPSVELPSGIRVIEVTGSEDSKTLRGCENVLVEMRKAGVRRGDRLAAIGGGVVQDVATLVSSLYMRGIPWIYVPSTLTSMADSCIGGKSSINAGGMKNLAGNIYPPQLIYADPDLLATLPAEAIAAGLAEAVKICFCRGGSAFHDYLALAAELPASPAADPEQWAALVNHVLRSKKWFVEVDEFDQKERQQLNFGHSFGHAVEAASGFALPHGVAVALGMLAACEHPAARGPDVTALVDYCVRLLEPVEEIVRRTSEATDWEHFRSALASDKKNRRGTLRLVIPSAGGVEFVEAPLDDPSLRQAEQYAKAAFRQVLGPSFRPAP